jgi:outer membrane lipoprotein-sorting protein
MFCKILNSFLSVIISGPLLASDIKADNLFQFFADKYFLETSFTQTTSKDFKDRQIRGKLNATRSGNFKIEYFEPMREIISVDDNFLYKLDIELEQLDIVPREEYFKDTPINIFITKLEDLNDTYLVESCINKNNSIICTITTKDLDSFVDKLFLKFTANELTELSYIDSFGQSVTLEFDEISWKKFDEAKLLIETPEGIDVVYH